MVVQPSNTRAKRKNKYLQIKALGYILISFSIKYIKKREINPNCSSTLTTSLQYTLQLLYCPLTFLFLGQTSVLLLGHTVSTGVKVLVIQVEHQCVSTKIHSVLCLRNLKGKCIKYQQMYSISVYTLSSNKNSKSNSHHTHFISFKIFQTHCFADASSSLDLSELQITWIQANGITNVHRS